VKRKRDRSENGKGEWIQSEDKLRGDNETRSRGREEDIETCEVKQLRGYELGKASVPVSDTTEEPGRRNTGIGATSGDVSLH